VDVVNKPGWRSVIVMKPRDLFAMHELELEDSIDVGFQGINDLLGGQEDLTTSWTRSDKEGTTGDVFVIAQVQAEAADEPNHVALLDDNEDEEDDTYIDDGVVASTICGVESRDDDFFICLLILFCLGVNMYRTHILYVEIKCFLNHTVKIKQVKDTF